MAIRSYFLSLLDSVLEEENITYQGLKMLELGNQKIREENLVAKDFFIEKGVEHISIDINGLI